MKRSIFVVLWVALVVHLIQGLSLIWFPTVGEPIDIAALLDLFPNEVVPDEMIPGIMFGASGLALIGLVVAEIPWIGRLMLFLPQQGLIVIAAWGAMESALRGSYSDGTIKPGIHIFNDQLWLIAFMVVHAYAVTRRAGFSD